MHYARGVLLWSFSSTGGIYLRSDRGTFCSLIMGAGDDIPESVDASYESKIGFQGNVEFFFFRNWLIRGK